MVLVGPTATTFTCNIGVCRAQVAPTNEALREHLEAVHPDPCGNILDRSGPGFCPWNGCGGIQIRSAKERNKSGARTMKIRHILGLHGALRADYRCLVCGKESRLETKKGMEKHVRACLKKSRRVAHTAGADNTRFTATTAATTPAELLESDDMNTPGLTTGVSTDDSYSPVSPQDVATIRIPRKRARSPAVAPTAAGVNGYHGDFISYPPTGARTDYTPFEGDAAPAVSEDPPAAWQLQAAYGVPDYAPFPDTSPASPVVQPAAQDIASITHPFPSLPANDAVLSFDEDFPPPPDVDPAEVTAAFDAYIREQAGLDGVFPQDGRDLRVGGAGFAGSSSPSYIDSCDSAWTAADFEALVLPTTQSARALEAEKEEHVVPVPDDAASPDSEDEPELSVADAAALFFKELWGQDAPTLPEFEPWDAVVRCQLGL
ncbi:uncharacterized protein B0H18DRAFT_1008573 [Fomitopsis serialis]|uniref:uncharacterized protein n=1 Tax=Fomitopsis serialis TaxID=139415 RepID=UPI0020083928|nr:uncharacterized protein B0H18DRAFT_1008573 [Neoantrodia serialis]KAH9925827.1 hypothetical protein B0H18DRAFT_1008573 [Neoantrodia serialis]